MSMRVEGEYRISEAWFMKKGWHKPSPGGKADPCAATAQLSPREREAPQSHTESRHPAPAAGGVDDTRKRLSLCHIFTTVGMPDRILYHDVMTDTWSSDTVRSPRRLKILGAWTVAICILATPLPC